MTDTPEMVELLREVQGAINDAGFSSDPVAPARAAIAAHVTALDDAGLMIVPREPTEAMLDADYPTWPVNRDRNRALWSIMIDAALDK